MANFIVERNLYTPNGAVTHTSPDRKVRMEVNPGAEAQTYLSDRMNSYGPHDTLEVLPSVTMSHVDGAGLRRTFHVQPGPHGLHMRVNGVNVSRSRGHNTKPLTEAITEAAKKPETWPTLLEALMQHPDTAQHASPFVEAHTAARVA